MPQLPSGLHVGVCASPIIDAIKAGDFSLKMNFLMAVRSVEDIRSLVFYYRQVQENGLPADPYTPVFTLVDVDQKKVGWSEEDYAAFDEWQKLDAFKRWLDSSYQEIQQAVKNLKVKLPENLHGIMDAD